MASVLEIALTLIAAAGVGYATTVLARLSWLPRAARWIAAVVGAYGSAAFLYGALTGTSLSTLLAGQGPWRALPFVLQGAIVGGLFVLPVALLVSAVRIGLRTPVPGSRARAIREAAALATTLAIVLTSLPRRDLPVGSSSQGRSISAPSTTIGFVQSPERLAALDNSFRAIEDGLREFPRDTWDPDYIVARVGRDPANLGEWVRSNTSWIPYRGSLRGSAGVLMDGRGNSLDRSLLLATLLTKAGHVARLVRGDLTVERAREILPLAEGAPMPSESPVSPPDIIAEARRASAKYGLDTGVVVAISDYAIRGQRRMADIQSRVRVQAVRLRSMLAAAGPAVDPNAAVDSTITALQDHWWVQRQADGQWIDMDPLLDSIPGAARPAPTATVDPQGLPPALAQTVAIRVIAEHIVEGQRHRSTVLERVLRPADVLGKRVALRIWPSRWPSELGPGVDARQTLRTAVLDQDEWSAALLVDRTPVAGSVIRASQPVTKAQPAGGPMGGLAGAITRGLGRQKPPAGDLTTVWLEYEVGVPEMAPRLLRRILFDLPTEASSNPTTTTILTDKDRLRRGLSLMRETEILLLPCAPSPQFVLHLIAQNVIENRQVMRSAVSGADQATLVEFSRRISPAPTSLYALALSRFEWSAFRDRIYIDRPSILTRHSYLDVVDDRIFWQSTTDVVANELGVDLRAKDPFAVRLEQGVLDTHLETLMGVDTMPAANAAVAFDDSGRGWIALTSPHADVLRGLNLTGDEKRRIAEVLEAGYVVVVPRAPVTVQSNTFVAWWRVDPATGQSLGMLANGWGGAQTFGEYARAFVQAGLSELFMCEGLHEFVAQTRDGRELGAGAVSGFGVCVVGALAAGFTATLPILVMHIHSTIVARAFRVPQVPSLGRRFLPYDDGYPRLAGIKWPETLDRTTALASDAAGTVSSQQMVDKIIGQTVEMRALTQTRFQEAIVEFRAAAARSEATKYLPVNDSNRLEILAAEEAAGQKMNQLRQIAEREERILEYWTNIKPVNDQLVGAVAERDAAVARYNQRMFSAPVEEHLEITIGAIEAQARVRGLQNHINEVFWGRSSAAAAAKAVDGAKATTGTLAGVVGAGGVL